MEMFAIGWLHAPWSRQLVLVTGLLYVGLALIVRSFWLGPAPSETGKDVPPPPGSRHSPTASAGVLALLGLLLLSTTFIMLLVPSGRLQNPDGYSFYLLKARIFYIDEGVTKYFSDHAGFAYTVPDHPPLTPVLTDWLYLMIGGVEQQYAALINPIFASTIIMLLYAFGRHIKLADWISAALILVLGLNILDSILKVASPDLAVSAYVMLAALFVRRWLTERDTAYAILGAVGFGFAAWSKNEGLAIYYASSAALLCIVARNIIATRALGLNLTGLVVLLLGPYLLAAPWLVLKSTYGIDVIQGGLSSLNSSSMIVNRLAERAIPLASWLIIRAVINWDALLLIGLAALAINIRRAWLAAPVTGDAAYGVMRLLSSVTPVTCYTVLLLLGTMLMYLVGMLTSPDPLDSLIKHVTPRLIAQITPLFAVLLAAELGAMVSGNRPTPAVQVAQAQRVDKTVSILVNT
jgi:hypothetical protein